MLTYLAIADKYRPRWLVWENVPGVLSSNGGEDFGTFLGGLGELGYGFAYRVLDAQYFGVAQRRRRVFVVGCFGNWRAAAAVLFEPESLRGDIAQSREARQKVAQCLTRGVGQRYDPETESLIPSYGIPGNWIGRQPENGGNSTQFIEEVAPCLTSADKHGVAQSMTVRRLTPIECERLQGFPDGYTNIPWRKATESPDSPRYKALGNSMAVPVMAWIGRRIQTFADLQ
jgi:DNA (cytosine-5)-methyltransferase 1